jgi:4-methylaminobutanoate oxidase (formaldehyde-forming)
MAEPLPTTASIVVVGAGAIGCAVAWQLAEFGARDVLVLEKSAVTHGSTWHAAGLVGQYRSREDLTRLMRNSTALYNRIEAETPVDWRPVGSLRIASSLARLAEYEDAAPRARAYGVGFEILDAAEARRRFPHISLEGVAGAAFVEGDGYVDPSSLTQAYASRAQALGVRIADGVLVTGALHQGPRIVAVETDHGRVACETLVLAPGVWARALGRLMHLDLAVAALEHQYAVTDKRADLSRDLPALRDPDLNFYLKPEVGGFAIGGWEPDTATVHASRMPFAFGRELLPDRLERLEPLLQAAARRIPLVNDLGLRQIINGPIPVTPDGEPILGPAPGLANVMLAVGFTSGIAASGGAGQALAEWIVHGAPSFPLPSLDPSRFGTAAITDDELHRRAIRAYGDYYSLSAPPEMHPARAQPTAACTPTESTP